jgi:hypothetical protein
MAGFNRERGCSVKTTFNAASLLEDLELSGQNVLNP